MSAQLLKLAEQINEEFLTCKICWELYKEPKCLTCLHTFCKNCIESHAASQRSFKYSDYREFSCPLCRKKTSIPPGGVSRLPDNFIVLGLSDLVIDKTLKNRTSCDVCRLVHDRERQASVKCVECQKLLCKQCLALHQVTEITTEHSIYELELEKDVLCKLHDTEPVRYYCDECEACVCIMCTYVEHKEHKLVDFKKAVEERRETLCQHLIACKDKLGHVETYVKAIRDCDKRITNIQSEIHEAAHAFQQMVIDQEQDSINTLLERYGEDVLELVKRRKELDEYHEQLKNTCSLTELMLSGREIELLLVMKQLSDKLKELLAIDLQPLAENAYHQVMFVPGELKFGEFRVISSNIDDTVRCPIEEKQTTIRSFNDKWINTQLECNDSCIQTDNNCVILSLCDTLNSQSSVELNQHCKGLASEELDTLSDTSTTKSRSLAKLSRRVRRILKKNCSIAVLPNTDIIIIDSECNCISILDKRGRVKYFLSEDENADARHSGVGNFQEFSITDAVSRSVRINTPQGILIVKLKHESTNSLPLGFTVHAYNSVSYSASANKEPSVLMDENKPENENQKNACYHQNGG